MAIALQQFSLGDTDYVAKLNSDMQAIEASINALQVAQGSSLTGILAPMLFLGALFKGVTTLVGAGSYKPTGSSTTLTVAAGTVFKGSTGAMLQTGIVPISFVGVAAGTYYIVPDDSGIPTRTLVATDAVYSVVWSGSAFGTITQIAPSIFDAVEQSDSRISTLLGTFTSLDLRLEAGEAVVDALATLVATKPIRKVGITLSEGAGLTTGVKGAIQVDFPGTIIGWSVVADQSGSLSVEIDKKASSIPPAVPAIPNTTTDKISASAPVILTAAQSAAVAAAGVSTWTTAVARWDVIQFNVVSVSSLVRATLYLRIQET